MMEVEGTQPSLLDPVYGPPVQAREPEWVGVAQVSIDSPLPHLDRLFDYGIPASMDDDAHLGMRVRVRFAGLNRDGVIIKRLSSSTHGELKPLRRIVGLVPVLTPEVLELCQAVANRYAGGLADVLRLALPPRHATTEKSVLAEVEPTQTNLGNTDLESLAHVGTWDQFPAGAAFIQRLAAGEKPRAVWSALPGPVGRGTQNWARAIASASAATLTSGRGVLVIAPTAEELAELGAAFKAASIDHVELTAEQGAGTRYRNFLTCLLGRTRVVLGTRAAAYAPVKNLGLVVCWDEPHDTYAEPRAPYPHARDVLVMRADMVGAGALIGGFARTPQAEHLVLTGWAHHLGAKRTTVRAQTPRVIVPDEFDLDREGAVGRARIPQLAWRKITKALETGPVLLQVPRAGYMPQIACARCQQTARCTHCHGPLAVTETAGGSPEGNARASCQWCGRADSSWVCPHCEYTTWRAQSVGAGRTAEELGRAFPGVPIRVSGRSAGKVTLVDDKPQLLIATPGAEPPAERGYPLAVFLDAGSLTNRPFLNASVDAVHRWLRAASLVRPDGEVLILGDGLPTPTQTVVRWDPAGFARRELAEWTTLNFPPATTVVAITGEKDDVTGLQRYLSPVPTLTVLGPVPLATGRPLMAGDGELDVNVDTPVVRLLLRTESSHHEELTASVRSAVRIKSARRDGNPVNVRVNPTELL